MRHVGQVEAISWSDAKGGDFFPKVHESMIADALVEYFFRHILVIGQYMVDGVVDAVECILLAVSVVRQDESAFPHACQFLPVTSVRRVKQGVSVDIDPFLFRLRQIGELDEPVGFPHGLVVVDSM